MVGILFPSPAGRAPRPPEATAFGRAALDLAEEGVTVLMGDAARQGVLTGHVAEPGSWRPARATPDACYHRFPDGDRPGDWARLRAGLGPVVMVNPPEVVGLCRDKLNSQAVLEAAGVAMPAVVGDDLAAALQDWGAGFLKPRHGAFGRGVRRVVAGEALPPSGDWVLQRAVPPPRGLAGVSVRALVQRDPDDGWRVLPLAVRRHADDPVVNHARGAEVVDASTLDDATRQAIVGRTLAVAQALAGWDRDGTTGELGVDLVVDPHGEPWPIEVNAKPRGRLAALAAADPRWRQAHHDAVARPLRLAARLATARRDPHRGVADGGTDPGNG